MARCENASACASDDHLRPIRLDGAESSWESYVEEDVFDFAEGINMGEAELLLLSFEMSEAVSTAGPVALIRATLTDG